MGRGNGGEGPVKEVKGQEVNFHCSMLPCIHFEIQWMDPLPAPTFSNWRAVDNSGQAVTLTPQHFQRIIRDVTTGPFPITPPQTISTMPCIAPCSCTDEQAFPWIQKGQFIPIDTTLAVSFDDSTATDVTVSVKWMAAGYRWVVGRCAQME